MIREATSDDLVEVARIHAEGWKTAYPGLIADEIIARVDSRERLDRWRQWVAVPGWRLFVELASGAAADASDPVRLAGFVRVGPARPSNDPAPGAAEVTHLYVDPGVRGAGTGARLLARATGHAVDAGFERLVLWTLEGNAGARRFYEREGLVADGARKQDPGLGGASEVRYQRALARERGSAASDS